MLKEEEYLDVDLRHLLSPAFRKKMDQSLKDLDAFDKTLIILAAKVGGINN